MGFRDGFFMDFGGYGGSFALREPLRFGYSVVEEEEDDDAEDDRGDGLEEEEPLPPGEACATGEVVQDEAGQGTADDSGDGVAGHQQGNHCGSAMGWEPGGEVENHAREKAGFGSSQQQTCGVELHRGAHQSR